ncbi:ATP-binding cassette sub- A member 2 [Mortierella sp. AD094]|nr:ATP-binding cassette sub- A member 2 [Mortierella sp. AD094]
MSLATGGFSPAHISTTSFGSQHELHPMQDLETPLMAANKGPRDNSVSRATAQTAFNVVSEPSPIKQLIALSIKNIRIRSRDYAQTINALFQPVWMMLILVFLHLSATKAPNHISVKPLPFLTVDTCKSTTDCVHFGYTGVPANDPIITEISGFFAASEPNPVISKFYTDETAMRAAYDASPVNFVIGAVFFPSTNLTVPTTPGKADLYQYTILANHTAYVYESYLDTRYATVQAYIERAAINLRRKANNKPALSSPLPLKADPGTANSGAGRTFISYANFVGLSSSINQSLNAYYVIFCFQAVWLGVLSILVVEKKKGIRAAMSMMGMSRNSYLISIWVMQNIQNLATCALMVFILYVGKIFTNTNAFIVWLLLVLFSFNATAFGTIASVFIPDPKKTNTVSFVILIFTVGSYGICSAFVFGGTTPLTPTKETLVYLLPSVALGRAINYITGMEAALGGVTFENISTGPCAKALWMMVVDCLIFYFLAWYIDAVVPTRTSSGLPLDFFLRASYWGIGRYSRAADSGDALRGPAKPLDLSRPYGDTKHHADMYEQADVSRIPAEDRGIIQVQGLRKDYPTGPGWGYKVPLFGIFFRIFYPPNSERTTGPFSGVQKNEVVAGLDLEVHRNEIMGFLGHNGAGKTTSLSMIMGMINPTSGSIVVNGHLLPGSSGISRKDMDMRTLEEVQKQMGVCPQHDVLFDTLTAWEIMKLYASIKGVVVLGRKSSYNDSPSSREELLEEYLDHLLDDVYLKEKKHERVSTYSGGMKRKLSVALAFLGDPKVVLLDEPTTGMDIFSKKQIWQLMQDSKAGRAILLTTHSMEEADALSDRIAILSKGELQTLGSSLFLKNRFGVGYHLSFEKRRVMLADQIQKHEIQSTSLDDHETAGVVLFNEERTTAIVKQYFPDATIDVNTVTDITYVLPTTGTAEQRQGRTAQQYIEDKKAALPGLFSQLDQEIAANRLGVKSVGLALTTLEEVFISLQEQEEAEMLAKKEEDAKK